MKAEKDDNVFSLAEIAQWSETGKVSLPNVQRGFVWKASQIENLWDSLFRGYPIGAFVLSRTKENPNKFEMLDGQQRATAICLGFGKKTFRKETQDHYKLFIDLELPKEDDERKYIFRIITKSHPWGYQRTDNSKPLNADEKRASMELYSIEDHLEEDLNKFFPFDTSLPVPFHFFTDAANNEENINQLLGRIKGWSLWIKVNEVWSKWLKENINSDSGDKKRFKESLEISTERKIERRIAEIYKVVNIMLHNDCGQKVPVLYLDFEKLKRQELNQSEKKTESFEGKNKAIEINASSEKEETDAIENLFLRLNSGGTPLSGEELNYSILKSNLKDDSLIEDIERACIDLIKPARFITIAYRLYQKNLKNNSRESISMRIKPKQFQRTLNEPSNQDKETFEEFLHRIIDTKKFVGKRNLLEYGNYLLEYKEGENTYGLPHITVCKIADKSPEIMFMLLYRLENRGDKFTFNTDEEMKKHRKMLGIITILMWLGKGEKQRDHARVLSNIWPAVETLQMDLFWSSSTVQRALIDDVMTSLPSFQSRKAGSKLQKLTKSVQSNTDLWNRFWKSDHYYFIYKMFFERDLVIYAQREFLSKAFKNQEYHQDDTNMPFDWDHISPAKFINTKKRIPKIIKDWYNSNGNLRAWPYSFNRTDQAVVPARKFDPLNPKKYSEEQNNDLERAKYIWNNYFKKSQALINESDQLNTSLLNWSFCKIAWLKCDSEDLKWEWKPVYELIMERNFELCKEWYKELMIEELITYKSLSLDSILNKIKWQQLKSKFNDRLLKNVLMADDFNTWISKPIKLKGEYIYMYLQFSKEKLSILEEDNLYFGIYGNDPGELIESVVIKEEDEAQYYKDRKNYIQGNFTLISFEKYSYQLLVSKLFDWIKNFPNATIKAELPQEFLKSIKSGFMPLSFK